MGQTELDVEDRIDREWKRYANNDANQYAKKFRRDLERLKESDIAQKDKEAILDLVDWKRADDAAVSSLHQYVQNLMLIARRADTPLMDMSEADLQDLFIQFANGTHPDVKDDGVSLQAYQIAMRNFVKVHDTDYSDLPRRHDEGYDMHPLTITDVPGRDIEPEDLLYQEEIDALLDACGMDVRYKAMVAWGLASGQRLDALRTVRVGDVEWSGPTGDIRLNTTDGQLKGNSGKVPLLWAKHYLQDWLDVHPFKDADDFEEKYIFCADPRMKGANGDRNGDVPLDGSTIRKRLKVLANRANLDKRVYPHLLRHTAITRMVVEGLSEQQVKKIVGWDPDSSQFGTYVHLAEELSNDSIRKTLGLPTSNETNRPLLGMPKLIRCPECEDQIPDGATRCRSCEEPLTDAEYVKSQAGERTTEKMQEETEERIVEVESKMEAKIVKEVLKEIRENPERYAGDE
jgi:integrase